MLEGLFISVVGMSAVFVSLIVIMLLMMGIQRAFRDEELAAEDTRVVPIMYPEGIPSVPGGPKELARPEDTTEVAAVALALAVHVRKQGKWFGTTMSINEVDYQVNIGDTSRPPVSVVVNGVSFRGGLGDEGLPIWRSGLRIVPQARSTQRERVWRSAHPPFRGGYWCRRGWTGRRDGEGSQS